MTQDEKWQAKYNEIVAFINKNHRNPSRYDAEERGKYCNWLHHNKKVYNAGGLKAERMELFKALLDLMEVNKHKNQYE